MSIVNKHHGITGDSLSVPLLRKIHIYTSGVDNADEARSGLGLPAPARCTQIMRPMRAEFGMRSNAARHPLSKWLECRRGRRSVSAARRARAAALSSRLKLSWPGRQRWSFKRWQESVWVIRAISHEEEYKRTRKNRARSGPSVISRNMFSENFSVFLTTFV